MSFTSLRFKYFLIIALVIVFLPSKTFASTNPSASWNAKDYGNSKVVELTNTYAPATITGTPAPTPITGPVSLTSGLSFTSASAVNLGHNFAFGSSDFTMAIWMKSTSGSVIVAMGESATKNIWCGFLSGAAACSISGSASTTYTMTSAGANDGNWHLVALIRRGDTLYLSVDGVDVANHATAAGETFNPTDNMFLNQFGAGGGTGGSISIYEAGIWQGTGLLSSEMATKFSAPATLWSLSAATSMQLTGPTGGTTNVASANFTAIPNGVYTGTITPASTGAGTFSPSSLTFSSSATPQTFTYTPTSASGSPHSVSISASPTLTAPSAITYSVSNGVPTVPTAAWNVRNSGGGAVAELTNTYASGAIIGTPTAITGPASQGSALSFNSTNAVTLRRNFAFGSSDFTMAVWLKSTSSGVIGAMGESSGRNIWCGLNGGSAICSAAGSVGSYTMTSPGANDGNWHLIALIRRGNTLYLSVDGVDVANQATAAGETFSPTDSMFLNQFGADGTVYRGSISIYEAGIWQGTGLLSSEMATKFSDPATMWSLASATSAQLNGPQVGALNSASVNFTITPNGVYTGTITPASTGAGTFSPTSLTFSSSATPQTFTYTPTSASGSPHSVSISASPSVTTTGTVSYAVTSGAVAFTVDNAAWASGRNPYTWYVTGSSSIESTNPGAYFKVKFSGTSAIMSLDISGVLSSDVPIKQFPRITWQVDGGTWQIRKILPTDSQVVLSSALTNSIHTLQVIFLASDAYSRRSDGSMELKITGLTLDTGQTLSAATMNPAKLIAFGDSITEGAWVLGAPTDLTNYSDYEDTTASYIVGLASDLNAEYGNAAFGGETWDNLVTGWNYYFGSNSRLSGGLLSPPPDYLLVNMGTNGGVGSSATVSNWLSSVRAASGSSTYIFVIVPFNGTGRTNITAGLNNYVTSSSDHRAFLIDLGSNGLTYTASPTYSYDGTHPNAAGDAQLRTLVSAAIQADIVSNDATLSNLTISAGTLAPAFTSGTTSYTDSVGNGTTSVTVTPTRNQANATITVNGTSITSGSPSGPISLNVGSNIITTVVTAQDGTTTDTYTITVTRAASSDATMSNLTISSGTLSPSFASGTTSYTDSVANGVASVTVTPTRNQANATITVNNTTVTSGSPSGPISLSVGSNVITTIVTAQDGTTTNTYTITVTRAGSSDATLGNLTISAGTLAPSFASGTASYTASVGNGITSVTVTPTRNQSNATITVNGTPITSGSPSGAISLNVGSNIITTIVTAQDGTTTNTYTITVTRASLASDATLANLGISSGTLSPSFASGTTSYTNSVSNSVTSLTVTPTASEVNATITVNSITVASGISSDPISLNIGDNIITIVVTAQNGITTDTYTITVTRAVAATSISSHSSGGRIAPSPVMLPILPLVVPPPVVVPKTTAYNFGTAILKIGSRGEAVKELQRFLNAKLNLGLVVDGRLGAKTIAVIKKWQKAHGLIADGLIGTKTKAKMNADVK